MRRRRPTRARRNIRQDRCHTKLLDHATATRASSHLSLSESLLCLPQRSVLLSLLVHFVAAAVQTPELIHLDVAEQAAVHDGGDGVVHDGGVNDDGGDDARSSKQLQVPLEPKFHYLSERQSLWASLSVELAVSQVPLLVTALMDDVHAVLAAAPALAEVVLAA